MSIVEQFTPTPAYTVAGTGPYRIEHAYLSADELTAFVIDDDGAVTTLDADDWSVDPASSYTIGDLTLSSAAATAHAGKSLRILRDTDIEQGWATVETAREAGIAAQLARTVLAVQDAAERGRFTLSLDRLSDPVTPPVLPAADRAGRAVLFSSDGGTMEAGPTADEVAAAQGYAEAAEAAADRVDLGALDQAVMDSETARDKAQGWAEEVEDTEVEAGLYSAKHHAAKASADRLLAETAKGAAETAQGLTETARDVTETYAGVVSQATSVAGLTDPTTLTEGDKGIVSGSGDTAVDGLYEVQSSAWVRIGATGLVDVREQVDARVQKSQVYPYTLGSLTTTTTGNTFNRAVVLKYAAEPNWYSDANVGGAHLGPLDIVTNQDVSIVEIYIGTFDGGASTVEVTRQLMPSTRIGTGSFSFQFLEDDGSYIDWAENDRIVLYERGIARRALGSDQAEINTTVTVGTVLSTTGSTNERAVTFKLYPKTEIDWRSDDLEVRADALEAVDADAAGTRYEVASASGVGAAKAARDIGPVVEARVDGVAYDTVIEGGRVIFTPTPDVVIDSVNGGAGNAGTRAAPKAALADHGTPTAGQMVALVAGSDFEESLAATAGNLGIFGIKDDDADLPIIDCAGVITETWTKEGTATNVYYVDVSHGITEGQTRLGAWEAGVQLVSVASIAACDALAGSYYSPSDEALAANDPARLYVHPLGSTDPTSDGKLYETVRRVRSIGGSGDFNHGDDQTVEGVETGRQAKNNGSIVVGLRSKLRRVLARDGHKHNALQESGLTEDCVFWGATSKGGSGGTSLHVYFTDSGGTGLEAGFERCGFYGNDRHLDAGLGQISTSVGHGAAYDTKVNRMNWVRHANGLLFPGGVDGLYSEDAGWEANFSSTENTFQRILNRRCNDSAGIQGTGTFIFSDICHYGTAADDIFRVLAAATLRVKQGTYLLEGRNDPIEVTGSFAATITNEDNIYVADGAVEQFAFNSDAGLSLSLGRNLYVGRNGGSFLFSGPWGNAFTLQQIQALGYETNSVFITAEELGGGDLPGLFVGGYAAAKANGDFRISTRSARRMGDGAPFSEIGCQTHHDWQSGEVLQGPPSRWPTIPQTLAEAREYVRRPREWRYYA